MRLKEKILKSFLGSSYCPELSGQIKVGHNEEQLQEKVRQIDNRLKKLSQRENAAKTENEREIWRSVVTERMQLIDEKIAILTKFLSIIPKTTPDPLAFIRKCEAELTGLVEERAALAKRLLEASSLDAGGKDHIH